MPSNTPPGSSLGTKLTDISARARVKARESLLPAENAMKAKFLHGFMEHGERELADTVRPAMDAVTEAVPPPDHLAGIMNDLRAPRHQWQVIMFLGVIVGLVLDVGRATVAGYAQKVQRWALYHEADVPLSPDQLAVAALKGAVGEEWAADQAGYSGMGQENWRSLLRATGDPPGPETLLSALRRGLIDGARFREGIRQGRVRDEWVPFYLSLRHGPLSPADGIRAAIEGHVDMQGLSNILEANGISEGYSQLLYDTAGRPPGVQELLELVNRGEYTEGDVAQAIRESDIKNKYVDAILKLRYRLPPERSVVAMVRRGTLDPASGADHLARLGYHPEDVSALIQEATATKLETGKQLTVSELVAAYEMGVMSFADARQAIVDVRYADADADVLLHLADSRKERRYVDQATNQIRGLYVRHRIDRAETSGFLDRLQIDSASRDHFLALWDLERNANSADLTPAQIGTAWGKGLLSDEDAWTRLHGLGYDDADAAIVLQLHEPSKPLPGSTGGTP